MYAVVTECGGWLAMVILWWSRRCALKSSWKSRKSGPVLLTQTTSQLQAYSLIMQQLATPTPVLGGGGQVQRETVHLLIQVVFPTRISCLGMGENPCLCDSACEHLFHFFSKLWSYASGASTSLHHKESCVFRLPLDWWYQ